MMGEKMPAREYSYHNKKGRKPFSKIAPLWWKRIKEYGLEDIALPMRDDTEDVELDISSLQYCIVGEAYDFFADRICICKSCLDYANEFDRVATKISSLNEHNKDDNYYWDRLRWLKKKFNTKRKEFTNHWNEKHNES